jgi:CRP-like cAMP-binding protein
MTQAVLVELLRQSRFLEGVGPEDLARIASVARLQEYPGGAVLVREGQCLPHIFLVAEGNVALEICIAGQGCKRIQTVGPGDLLGWSPILDQSPMTATARALGPTRLIAVDAAQVLGLCSNNPAFGYVLMRHTALALASRLSATRLQLLDVYRHELPTGEFTGETQP